MTLSKLTKIVADKKELRYLQQELEKQVEHEIKKRKESELLLTHHTRMAEMGEMLTLTTHQWKQPLTSLGLLTYDLKDAYEHNEFNQKYLKSFLDNSNKQITFLSDTIHAFQDFLQPNKEQEYFEIKRIIVESIHLHICTLLKEHIKLTLTVGNNSVSFKNPNDIYCYDLDFIQNKISNEIGRSKGFINEFKQVIVNLIQNSRDAIMDLDEKNRCIDINISADTKYAYIKVSDNGALISQEIQEHMFDSFYTTKAKKGTGMGLYLAKIVIHDYMNGQIYYEEIEANKTFVVKVPLY